MRGYEGGDRRLSRVGTPSQTQFDGEHNFCGEGPWTGVPGVPVVVSGDPRRKGMGSGVSVSLCVYVWVCMCVRVSGPSRREGYTFLVHPTHFGEKQRYHCFPDVENLLEGGPGFRQCVVNCYPDVGLFK